MPLRVTGPLIKVLMAFLEDPTSERYGLQLLRVTGIKSGTLYPLLDRLEDVAVLTSRWESPTSSTSGGPRRRFYRLTGSGVHEARQIVGEFAAHGASWAL
jgi:DNA-binding PadR family transcriptional regulator